MRPRSALPVYYHGTSARHYDVSWMEVAVAESVFVRQCFDLLHCSALDALFNAGRRLYSFQHVFPRRWNVQSSFGVYVHVEASHHLGSGMDSPRKGRAPLDHVIAVYALHDDSDAVVDGHDFVYFRRGNAGRARDGRNLGLVLRGLHFATVVEQLDDFALATGEDLGVVASAQPRSDVVRQCHTRPISANGFGRRPPRCRSLL